MGALPAIARALPQRAKVGAPDAMIHLCTSKDLAAILEIVNDGAQAYRGVIPADCWKEPYMPAEELAAEIEHGVEFWGWEQDEGLTGVMGTQRVSDVCLIRHAYVRASHQRQKIGSRLLTFLCEQAALPLLVGTWAQATWAVRFYEKHGFRLVSTEWKDRLLRRYWAVPERQMQLSVVLADARWLTAHRRAAAGAEVP